MKLITAKNKELECNMLSVIEDDRHMFATVEDITFPEAAVIFSDTEETMRLFYGNTVYEGFTRLEFIRDQGKFKTVSLRKEV